MTDIFKLLPVVVSALLLGAHFLRSEQTILVGLSLMLPFSLLIKQAWSARLVQFFLVLGTAEWVRTLFLLAADRRADGQPWTRLVIIIGLVAAFTGFSALVFRCSSLQKRYNSAGQPKGGGHA